MSESSWRVNVARMVVVFSAVALGTCGWGIDEGNGVEPEVTESDAVEPPVDEGTFAEVNGVHLYYEVQGDGPWLVLVGGAHLDSRLWNEQVVDFAERLRVLRYDVRGLGQSDVPQEPFSHYEDLHALLEHLGIERAHLLGFSFGAGVALDFTLAYPQKVASLILVSPGLSSWKEELVPILTEISETAASEGYAEAIDRLLADPSMPRVDQEEARERMRALLEDGERLFATDFAYLRRMEPLAPPAEERLDEIDVPTLLIVGERDHPSIHENVDALQEGIAGARKVLIMGVGHMVSLERPEELRRIVLDFLGTD